MAFAVDAGAVRVRSRVSFDAPLEPRPFPELDCVRSRLAAEARAGAFGTGADRVLISSGALDEETYLRALGESLGVTFEPLDLPAISGRAKDISSNPRPLPRAAA
jgi:hypothetical protein